MHPQYYLAVYRRCCSRVRNGKCHVLANGLGEPRPWPAASITNWEGESKTSQQAHLERLRANGDCLSHVLSDLQLISKLLLKNKTKSIQYF